jgi:hypothetical protein
VVRAKVRVKVRVKARDPDAVPAADVPVVVGAQEALAAARGAGPGSG